MLEGSNLGSSSLLGWVDYGETINLHLSVVEMTNGMKWYKIGCYTDEGKLPLYHLYVRTTLSLPKFILS